MPGEAPYQVVISDHMAQVIRKTLADNATRNGLFEIVNSMSVRTLILKFWDREEALWLFLEISNAPEQTRTIEESDRLYHAIEQLQIAEPRFALALPDDARWIIEWERCEADRDIQRKQTGLEFIGDDPPHISFADLKAGILWLEIAAARARERQESDMAVALSSLIDGFQQMVDPPNLTQLDAAQGVATHAQQTGVSAASVSLDL